MPALRGMVEWMNEEPPLTRVRCPSCHCDTALSIGVEVPGWQAVNGDLTTTGERDVDWSYATPDATAGCGECGWDGLDEELERLDQDGHPLRPIHPRQEKLNT